MDNTHHHPLIRRIHFICKRIQELSKSGPKIPLVLQRQATGVLLIMGAILLGLWGYRLAQTEADRQWKQTQAASARIWKHTLSSFGFVLVSDQKILNRVLRNLPIATDAQHVVWMSTDHDWVAILIKGEPEPMVFGRIDSLKTIKPRLDWKTLGLGWPAFDASLEILMHEDRLPKTIPKKKKLSRDPKAIHY